MCYFICFPIAIYNYGQEGVHQLRLMVGDVVQILEECEDWYYGCSKYKGTWGIFPKSYVHIITQSMNMEALMHEITSVLREWGHHWKHLYVVCFVHK